MTYSPTKFEVATSNGLGGDTFTRNVTDGRTYARTDGRTDRRTDRQTDGRTDFDTKLIYPFFSKEKSGYNYRNLHGGNDLNGSNEDTTLKSMQTGSKFDLLHVLGNFECFCRTLIF